MPIKKTKGCTSDHAPTSPNVPYTGDNADYIFKGLNLIPEWSQRADFYYRMFRGIETQNQTVADVAMTGTVGIATATGVMTGVGTVFKQQLVLAMDTGQRTHLPTFARLPLDTSATVSPAPSVPIPAGTMAYLPQTLVTVDKDRRTLMHAAAQSCAIRMATFLLWSYGTVYPERLRVVVVLGGEQSGFP